MRGSAIIDGDVFRKIEGSRKASLQRGRGWVSGKGGYNDGRPALPDGEARAEGEALGQGRNPA